MSDFTGYAKADSRKPFCNKAEFHRVNGTVAEKKHDHPQRARKIPSKHKQRMTRILRHALFPVSGTIGFNP